MKQIMMWLIAFAMSIGLVQAELHDDKPFA